MSWLRHQKSKRKLDGFVDEELAGRPRVQVRRHLDECPDCSAHVRMLLAVRRSLRRMTGPAGATRGRLQARFDGPNPPEFHDTDPAV